MKPYCKEHIERFQTIVGTDDWHQFLLEENRLRKIMDIARPYPNPDIDFHCGGKISWITVVQLVGTDWFGLWPNPTPKETWIAEQIRRLCVEVVSLDFGEETEHTRRAKQRYLWLSQQ